MVKEVEHPIAGTVRLTGKLLIKIEQTEWKKNS
jgi:hypothetical protein